MRTPFGFHIIRIDRVLPAQVKASHILIIPKTDSADVARARLIADTVILKWRSGTPYDSLVKYYHDPDETRIQSEIAIDSTMPEEYRNAIDGVKKGQLTRPFAIPNPRTGQPGNLAVLFVTERSSTAAITPYGRSARQDSPAAG